MISSISMRVDRAEKQERVLLIKQSVALRAYLGEV